MREGLGVSEPREVQFDLDPVALVDLMTSTIGKIRQVAVVAVLVLFGVLTLAIGVLWEAIPLFALAVAWIAIFIRRLPKLRQGVALRLAGPTVVRFSDEGMEFHGTNTAERVPWPRFRRVIDRPDSWLLQTREPIAVFIVPKSAVPAAAEQQFAEQLEDWSGDAYRFRRW